MGLKHVAIFSLLFSALVLGCGTYRTGSSGGYHGMGGFKAPSDYSQGTDDDAAVDGNSARRKLDPPSHYVARFPFKLYWPVSQVRINRGFHPPEDPAHAGVDLGGKKGMPILAAHEGVVIYTGRDFNGYGNMVLVEYNDEWATLYGHLDQFTVSENTVVGPGDQIGTMGATGHATGVHLHFEVLHHQQPMDPLTLLSRPSNYTMNSKARRKRGHSY